MSGRALPRRLPASPPNAGARKASSPDRAEAVQNEEQRKLAATRRLIARLRSLEAILAADLRRRGRVPLTEAVDQWYAEAGSAAATGASIANTARAVIARI